ncbi:hypothetical protein AX16_002397 [Volvariella volvacea WC 439]|nr:hypothetical protein AX16_002397 [Volvariella volvacea WC 439]
MSPAVARSSRQKILIASHTEVKISIPLTPWIWLLSLDIRKAAESLLLISSTLYAANALKAYSVSSFALPAFTVNTSWTVLELYLLVIVSVLYTLWAQSHIVNPKEPAPSPAPEPATLSVPLQSPRSSSPRLADHRDYKRNNSVIPQAKSNMTYIWMSVPKNYRQSSDDGILTGVLFGPIIACALLVSALRLLSDNAPTLPAAWRIETPVALHNPQWQISSMEALVLSRLNLVDLASFCSALLLLHVGASWWLESRCSTSGNASEGERTSVPRSEGLRSWYYIIFTTCVSLGMFGIKHLLEDFGCPFWRYLSPFEAIIAASFYQFALYLSIRLAHRGFTLGELGLVCFGGTALFMEFLNITIARIWPVTTPFIKTYRLPTPLVIFQVALIAGSFLTGFILSPFLVLSRYIAQRPIRRLRHPEDKLRHRRYLALGFYVGTILIVGGLIGMWTRWCLGKRDPWLWVIFWLLEGKKQWTRPALLCYWAFLGSLSVAGWNRQLARSRKYRPRSATVDVDVPGIRETTAIPTLSEAASIPQGTSASTTGTSSALGLTFYNLPNGTNVSNVATDLLDAADKHVPTLRLNARRKFFHALAIVMFVPGVGIDPAFTHLSFSAAFALFTFAEYIRYFAVYPFGAAVHVFMNEFLDHRDSGTAILSHFYLLTGCAGAVWLEGPSQLLQFSGILALGVGDALASVVGKRMGVHRWMSSTAKTVEGSIAFTLSIVLSAWLLRLVGFAEAFSTLRYTGVVGLCSMLEAFSDQNDNLTLPLPSTAPDKVHHRWLPSLSAADLPSQRPLLPSDFCPHLLDSQQALRPSSPMHSVAGGDPDCILASPSPVPSSSQPGSSIQDSTSTRTDDMRPSISHSDCDWATFVSAYANGRWDPHRTPNPPRSCWPGLSRTYASIPDMRAHAQQHAAVPRELDLPLLNESDSVQAHTAPSDSPSSASPPNTQLPLPLVTAAPKRFRPSVPLNLHLPAYRIRNSFSNSSASLGQMNESPQSGTISQLSSNEVQTTVATMRWAAARVDLSPLALPSPEHELTDPMRGVTATIPGSHPQDVPTYDAVSSPVGTRKPRLAEFWQGTQDVDETESPACRKWEPMNISPDSENPSLPLSDPLPHSGPDSLTANSLPTSLTRLPSTCPASAPLLPSHTETDSSQNDYFGDPTTQHGDAFAASTVRETASARSTSPLPDYGTMSVPALPRRVCLTRQTSAPLPIMPSHEATYPGGRIVTDNYNPLRFSRAAKEEQMYAELGFLAPPNPPDELERRRALYKFNIWNTGPDLNFDRIAHLAKLVFNTRGVMISLIDGNDQWFKSEWGIKTTGCPRSNSFCAHAILQRGDEPMVVLDARLDWRFANNPLVTGPPHIHFYAGAPLRTQDGYNIGTLAVIDTVARDEFSPRQRHTLKEFAAIAMREMELWRDKIQLRIRDRIQNSMEQFSRECLEIDSEAQYNHKPDRPDLIVGASMDKVYDRAAKLVKRTLDVEGVIVMDVSHCEVLESMSAEGSVSVVMHHGDPSIETTSRQLSSEEYHKLNAFFAKHPDGKISEGIVPPCFRPFLPTHIQYALTVPIFNIDKRPFALLCAYNTSDHTKRFLEGHELSYLRAIGVIILSAVLKRRMILADKAKSLFISNISHELRTPLHGILAAAELLRDSKLSHSQLSFLQTVQACGNSLVETVNHVLDFTKLSGNSKHGGVENVIVPSQVDLMQLVEEAVDGCWIGHRARTASMGDTGIGSVYSPPKEPQGSQMARRKHVETVVDIGFRKEGWMLTCEKGGIRRVLMNLFGNSLKFTSEGFVHVVLHQLPPNEDDPPNKVKVELAVLDTGKGISQNFLKNQLFHPFSQENPLQTGTGLGLAIVNGIVQSESVGGKVDVWSEEGQGTEIRVTFHAEKVEVQPGSQASAAMERFKFDDFQRPPAITLVGFDSNHKGVRLLRTVMHTYLVTWWGFEIRPGPNYSEIVILNDDPAPLISATENRDINRTFILLTAGRGSPTLMTIASEYEKIGGFCRILYKPGGPIRLRAVLKLCLHALKIGTRQEPSIHVVQEDEMIHGRSHHPDEKLPRTSSPFPRRYSEERPAAHHRPAMTPRSTTIHPAAVWKPPVINEKPEEAGQYLQTVTIGSGGTLLQSSLRDLEGPHRHVRVLVVEDNNILRNLLLKWLQTRGCEYRDAVDGRDGVNVYEHEGPFDVVLLDLSMPVLDGISATAEIRRMESARIERGDNARSTRILALTGMSSLEDKRRAFDAGVDGYLVKPVAFKTLDDAFRKLGVL